MFTTIRGLCVSVMAWGREFSQNVAENISLLWRPCTKPANGQFVMSGYCHWLFVEVGRVGNFAAAVTTRPDPGSCRILVFDMWHVTLDVFLGGVPAEMTCNRTGQFCCDK